jgi:hypothetical protein
MDTRRKKLVAIACLASPILACGLIADDARARRAERRADEPALAALAPRLPTSDLALSGGARWLRSPSLEEPGAAFQDGPAVPDPDPAGGAMAPPVAVWVEEARRAPKTRQDTRRSP